MVKRSSAVRIGGCRCPRDVGEGAGLQILVSDGPGGAFRVSQMNLDALDLARRT
jgi:hypothetical protein